MQEIIDNIKLSGNKSKTFSCFDCSLLTMHNSKYYCQRWSCYTTKESIKFRKFWDLNTRCIPYSRLFANIITLAKLRTTAPLSGTPENPIQKFQEKIWKNGLNSVTLRQLDNIINDIQNGRHLQTDFGRLIGYGRPRYDSIALSAAVITRGRIGTSCADRETDCGNGQARVSRQTELLTEFAKLSGCWIADYQEQGEDFVYVNGQKYTYLDKGMENTVYDNLKTKHKTERETVVKIIDITSDWEHPFYYDISQLFDRILIHNTLFSNTRLKVVGFAVWNGVFKIVLQQFYVRGNAVSKDEITNYITQKINGLTPKFNFFFNKDFIIGDFHRKNVLKGNDGWLYVIDDILAFNHGDFKGLKGLVNNLSGIIKPTYYDYDTEHDFNDYGKSRTATNGLLKDVKAFAKRLQNDLGLEDYYFRGKKRTISTNHTECNVHFVVPQAQAPNNHLHITFYVDHPLRGINYDYTIEEWFPISLGPEHSFGDTCRFHIFDSYEEILRDIKIRYPIFRKPQTKQPEKVSPLFDYAIKLVKLKNGKTLSGTPENPIQKFQEKIWKNGLNSVTLRQLDNIINDIQNGRIETDTDRRLRQIAEQSSCVQLPRNNNRGMVRNCYKPQRKGNALIAAEICTGSCGRTNRSTSNYFIEGLIERWAKNAGYWIDDISEYAASKSWIRAEKLDGKESMIYTTMSNMIVKVWSMKNYFNNPRLAIEKIILHNFLFGCDTPLKICGFTKINHYLHFVLEQPIIKYQKESYNSLSIERYLKEKFPNRHIDKFNGQFIIHFPDFYVWDLHAGNVVKSKMDGNYYVIDCNIMFKNTDKKLQGVDSHSYTDYQRYLHDREDWNSFSFAYQDNNENIFIVQKPFKINNQYEDGYIEANCVTLYPSNAEVFLGQATEHFILLKLIGGNWDNADPIFKYKRLKIGCGNYYEYRIQLRFTWQESEKFKYFVPYFLQMFDIKPKTLYFYPITRIGDYCTFNNPLLDTTIKLLKIRNKTTKKIHIK